MLRKLNTIIRIVLLGLTLQNQRIIDGMASKKNMEEMEEQ